MEGQATLTQTDYRRLLELLFGTPAGGDIK